MNREDIVAVACRLCALYLLFQTIVGVPAVVQMYSDVHMQEWAVFAVVGLAAQLAIAVVFWSFPLTIARKLLPVMREARSEESLDTSVALSLGITLIGFWFLVQGAIELTYWLVRSLAMRGDTETPYFWTPENIALVWTTVVQTVIALGLVLGAPGIKRLIYWLRYR